MNLFCSARLVEVGVLTAFKQFGVIGPPERKYCLLYEDKSSLGFA